MTEIRKKLGNHPLITTFFILFLYLAIIGMLYSFWSGFYSGFYNILESFNIAWFIFNVIIPITILIIFWHFIIPLGMYLDDDDDRLIGSLKGYNELIQFSQKRNGPFVLLIIPFVLLY